MDPKMIKQIANDNHWRFVKENSQHPVMEFKNMDKRIIINTQTMTVRTILYHPRFKKFGATELVREKVTEELLRMIFHYPRIHTDKGYYIINKKPKTKFSKK